MAQSQPRQQELAAQMNLLPVKKTTVTLPLDLYRQLKIEAAKSDTEMSSIVVDALRKHLSENENEQ
jgi:hypothetical protein